MHAKADQISPVMGKCLNPFLIIKRGRIYVFLAWYEDKNNTIYAKIIDITN